MAYAKVVAENGREFYMREEEFEIGREAKLEGPRYFCVAENNTISKNHVKIFWKEGTFYIVNQSKNKVT
jgi:predicted component of type VI protein secretion system